MSDERQLPEEGFEPMLPSDLTFVEPMLPIKQLWEKYGVQMAAQLVEDYGDFARERNPRDIEAGNILVFLSTGAENLRGVTELMIQEGLISDEVEIDWFMVRLAGEQEASRVDFHLAHSGGGAESIINFSLENNHVGTTEWQGVANKPEDWVIYEIARRGLVEGFRYLPRRGEFLETMSLFRQLIYRNSFGDFFFRGEHSFFTEVLEVGALKRWLEEEGVLRREDKLEGIVAEWNDRAENYPNRLAIPVGRIELMVRPAFLPKKLGLVSVGFEIFGEMGVYFRLDPGQIGLFEKEAELLGEWLRTKGKREMLRDFREWQGSMAILSGGGRRSLALLEKVTECMRREFEGGRDE